MMRCAPAVLRPHDRDQFLCGRAPAGHGALALSWRWPATGRPHPLLQFGRRVGQLHPVDFDDWGNKQLQPMQAGRSGHRGRR